MWHKRVAVDIVLRGAYGGTDYGGSITPLRMVVGSKMSGEEPPLEVYHTQDKTQIKRVLIVE